MTFKLFFALGQTARRPATLILPCLILALGSAGCALLKPLPQADLSEPGWVVHEGQAVWRLPKGKSEIAGEVLVAFRLDGSAFAQFTKSPFPIVVARAAPGRWEIEFPPQNQRYAGRGAPPVRLAWLYLPRVLAGQPPPRNWTWLSDANGWRLSNRASGESVEGFFTR